MTNLRTAVRHTNVLAHQTLERAALPTRHRLTKLNYVQQYRKKYTLGSDNFVKNSEESLIEAPYFIKAVSESHQPLHKIL